MGSVRTFNINFSRRWPGREPGRLIIYSAAERQDEKHILIWRGGARDGIGKFNYNIIPPRSSRKPMRLVAFCFVPFPHSVKEGIDVKNEMKIIMYVYYL